MALKALLFVFLTPCCLSKISMFDDSVMYSFSWKVGRELEDKVRWGLILGCAGCS